MNEELVVRPNGRRLVLLMSAALGFVVAGVFLISTGGVKEIIARSVRTFADEMRWNRETFGWDLAFATAWLDRPGDDFVELLEHYRRAAEG